MNPSPVFIAMWSGPRNISTAMMRAFGARADAQVIDEPFYAAYLSLTGLNHPMKSEIIAAGETDWQRMAGRLTDPTETKKEIYYQKHMTHHMVSEIGRGWFNMVRHAFLIRRPEDVLASYLGKRETANLRDIGFVEQAEIFDQVVAETGAVPPVVEASDILSDPNTMLSRLCSALEIPFDPAMLSWPKGRRNTDGVWAPHWYARVEQSTGFGPPGRKIELEDLPDDLRDIASAAYPHYEKLRRVKL